jgi:uncharacterized membrane protein
MIDQTLRIARHLLALRGSMLRAFPHAAQKAIEHTIAAGEIHHDGELRFVVEGALSGAPLYRHQTPRERAIDLFSQLRMWDTEGRNGVLVYLLMADHAVEIVADRGVHAHAGGESWRHICRQMEAEFGDGKFQQGAVDGIRAINEILMRHYPRSGKTRNELPDKVLLL